ncbi:MAG: hypothetical protein IT159_14580 [Bryobacterales bacterium]|nr:hypothetical protein [Bryobacterales bacterium]
MRTLLSLLAAAALAAAPQSAPQAASPAQLPVEDTLLRLLDIRRVYVDRLGGGDAAIQIRDMIIHSLQTTRLFVITENEEKADAFLRGSAEDLIFTDTSSMSESLSARAAVGTGSNPDRTVADRRSRSASVSVGEQETSRVAERKHEAVAAVRLVSRDGDVLWSTTQESLGAKFLGASADVAQKVAKQLLKDYQAAKKLRANN